jgi:hypothetical protein
MLEFSEWLPDQAAYTNPGANDAKNCLPLTNKSYGPLKGLSSVVDALSNRIQGAASLQQSDGTQHTFCADDSDIYLLSATAFAEISKSTGAYTTATTDHVDFLQYGNRVISVNGHTDAPQTYLMGTDSAFSDLAGSPPQAKHSAVINNFVMLGNIDDAVDGVVPNRVHWCAIDAPTDWPTIGSADAASKQSDRQDLPNGLSVESITGAIGGVDGAVFMRESIYRISYVGSPLVMSFQEVERGRGTLSGKSVVNVGPFAFYLAEQGFFSFDGTGSTGIGSQKVDKYFFADLDLNFVDRITGVADPVNKIVMWSYPGSGNVDGTPNKVIAFNWETARWAYGEITADLLFSDTTIGYNLDNMDSFGDMDTLTTSLDDRFWVGGFASLSAFDSSHKLSTLSGAALEATMTTTEFGGMELFQLPNERLYVNGVRPYVDGGTYTVSLTYRDSPSGSTSTDGPNAVDSNGMAHFTRSCRYARATVTVAAGGTWAHAQGVDLDASQDGEV